MTDYVHKSGPITIRVDGLSAIETQLRELPDRVARNVLTKAVRATANTMRDEIRMRAPIGGQKHYLKAGKYRSPGLLKKSIVSKSLRARSQYAAQFIVGINWYKVKYAHLVEFGHRIVGHRPKRVDTGKRAKEVPFFIPTARRVEEGLSGVLKKKLMDGIVVELERMKPNIRMYGI